MFAVSFDDLGFATDYAVDPTLEYPSDGDWSLPEFVIAGRGHAAPVPQAIVRPTDAAPFLLSSSFVGRAELYGTPNPRTLCVFGQFERATLLDTRAPTDTLEIPVYPTAVAAARDEDLLLFAEFTRVTAVSAQGALAWQSAEIFAADLHIRRTDNGRIVCRGQSSGGEPAATEVTLDARTGEVIPR